jgi:hypothetical protein
VTFFRLCCAAVLLSIAALGLLHRHAGQPADPMVAVVAHLRAGGLKVAKPADALWGVPAVAVSVAGCEKPIEVVLFDFDGILSPGVMQAVLTTRHATPQISYAGQTFDRLDRAALYRLRVRTDLSQLVHTGDIDDPPVLLSFWPAACTPTAIL